MSNIEEYEKFIEYLQEIRERSKRNLDKYRNEYHIKIKDYEKAKLNNNNIEIFKYSQELKLAEEQYKKAQDMYKETISNTELELYEFQKR